MKQLMVVAAVLAALFLGALPAQAFPTAPSFEPAFGYDEAAAWAERFDALDDALPAELKVGITSQHELDLWVLEVLPFFEYEGVVGEGMLVTPPSIAFEYYEGGLYHNHVLGRTMTLTGAITLNARFANPVSPWYGRVDTISTVVHELAHAQGIKFGDELDEEVSAQLVTLEVLAAMADRGSVPAFAALVDELAYMSLASAKYLASAEGREPEFVALRARLLSPFELARAEKADRYWAADPAMIEHILSSYNYVPMREVYAALLTDEAIEGVDLPINPDPPMPAGGYGYGYGSEDDPEAPPPTPAKVPLVIDDLAYVFDHAEALAAEAGGFPEG